ncbi:uncharacterized protein C18orf19 homolog B-like [Ornithodoros turicata]|uniref:uncharacterized protein C18orf19 homolog B-like n=1 Tax=Ornithodoros turicata TaxID=34597 RepID=UPI003138AC5C
MSLMLLRYWTRIEIAALKTRRVITGQQKHLRCATSIYCPQRHRVCNVLRTENLLSTHWKCLGTSQRDLFSTKKDSSGSQVGEGNVAEAPKMGFFHRYHKMFKEYWYVMLPVHIVTSCIWFGSFYYSATCGVNVVPLLEAIGIPDVLVDPLRNSGLGHLATASAMYKLATPARYAVTLGATSVTIRQLSRRGLIKPMPTKDQIKQMIKDKISPP